MAEVLGRYSNPYHGGAKLAGLRQMALQNLRPEPWETPKVTVKTVRRLTPDQIQAIVADYQSGIGSYRLAKKYGVSDQTVRTRLRAAGVEIREHAS